MSILDPTHWCHCSLWKHFFQILILCNLFSKLNSSCFWPIKRVILKKTKLEYLVTKYVISVFYTLYSKHKFSFFFVRVTLVNICKYFLKMLRIFLIWFKLGKFPGQGKRNFLSVSSYSMVLHPTWNFIVLLLYLCKNLGKNSLNNFFTLKLIPGVFHKMEKTILESNLDSPLKISCCRENVIRKKNIWWILIFRAIRLNKTI